MKYKLKCPYKGHFFRFISKNNKLLFKKIEGFMLNASNNIIMYSYVKYFRRGGRKWQDIVMKS